MQDLIEACLRLRPDRLMLGELRGKEAFSFMRAVNTGHPGSISTLPADTPNRQELERVLNLMSRVSDEGRVAVRGLRTESGDDLEQAFILVRQDHVPRAGLHELHRRAELHIEADGGGRIDLRKDCHLRAFNDAQVTRLLRLMRELIEAERVAVRALRRDRLISDDVMRQVERDLDLEEARLE